MATTSTKKSMLHKRIHKKGEVLLKFHDFNGFSVAMSKNKFFMYERKMSIICCGIKQTIRII